MDIRFSGGFHRPLTGNPQERLSCWARFIRQTSCPSSFAEVGFELVKVEAPEIILVPDLHDPDLLEYLAGVADGIRVMIGESPGTYGGIEIHWVHGIEHPVDSSRRAFQIATETALGYALGEPKEGRGIMGGIGFTSRAAARAANNP